MKDKLTLIFAMLIVGSIGIFVNYIPLSSPVIACARAVAGTLFVLAVLIIKGKRINLAAIRKNAVCLLLSGAALGFNWILLFEAYRYTTVAVATLCYYMAPVFVVILSPIVLKEKLTPVKLACTALSVIGAVLISGAFGNEVRDMRGIGFGISAAGLYCAIILLNKKIKGTEGLERTLCQLAVSAVVMITYVLLTEDVSALHPDFQCVVLLVIVGVVHTGLFYCLYFPAIGRLPAQTSSVLSYIDPVTAIILSALFLNQPMNGVQLIGTALILGSALVNELCGAVKKKQTM